jgi:hypothetical protein
LNPVEEYIRKLRDLRGSGAAGPETSYYPALSNLLDAVGAALKPKVRCIPHPADTGAGTPDFGLFTAEQFQKSAASEPLPGSLPARGVVEAKPVADSAWLTAEGEQVTKYWNRYGQVLVTNYRDFLLVGRDPEGRQVKLESYSLAKTPDEFWAQAAHPRKMAEEHGERLIEYLKRAMLHSAPLTAPKDVAAYLASYAHDARLRIEKKPLAPLAAVREALEEALRLKFKGEEGDHFFRSTLVQTLFYGLFSAWALWARKVPSGDPKVRFDWVKHTRSLNVPVLRKLFHELAEPGQLDTLDLTEVLNWAEMTLNRVVRASFFAGFEEHHAVQYFYEPFLQAYDPELRKRLGVWYTPPEIVKYMVARVDTVLREELNLPDGLADPNVYVLDPCCGTGAYLVEVIDRIHATLDRKGGDATVALQVKRAALERVFGFEIMPAPFVISHLQLGLRLQSIGAALSGRERAGVFLTNALTGWEPPEGPKKRLLFPELEAERDAADRVKRDAPILVIIGNPPYNAFAGVSPDEEEGLVEPYKEGLISKWKIKKFNLDDFYVRFFRLAERRIAERPKPGKGVVAFISNHSWVFEPSFVVLREHLLAAFDKIWIENLHGDRKISEYAPDGRTSQTIFAMAGFSPGIQQGVVTSLWVRKGPGEKAAEILFRDDLSEANAADRRAQLIESLKTSSFQTHYVRTNPAIENRFIFRPWRVSGEYLQWPKIPDLAVKHFNGPVERRGFALISIERRPLEDRMRRYFDPLVSDAEIKETFPSLMMTGNRIVGPEARKKIMQEFDYDASRVVNYPFKPFDLRWCYLENLRPLFSEPSPDLLSQREIERNIYFITRDTADKEPEGPPFYFSKLVCDYDSISGHARHFPARLKRDRQRRSPSSPERQTALISESANDIIANLSAPAREYLESIGISQLDTDPNAAALIWLHALGIGFSPEYLCENADGIRSDWPHIPLPNSNDALRASAALGRQIADLLDTEKPVQGISVGDVRVELRAIGRVEREGGLPLKPESGDFDLTAGWGHGGKDGVTMPGKGRVIERDYTNDEIAAISDGAAALGLSREQALVYLGARTCDIYLNDFVRWRNVPLKVWEYTIGGYQVIKKWLSYRERKLLGRGLSLDEVNYVTEVARRIAAILLLQPRLDANYRAVSATAYPWPTRDSAPGF